MRARLYTFLTALALPGSLTARAEAPQSVDGVVQALKGTRWQGNYANEVGGGTIRISFQPDLTTGGDLQYFHKLVGPGEFDGALGKVDVACPFTPRSIHLVPGTEPGTQTGQIAVFPCAKTAEEEQCLSKGGDKCPDKIAPKDRPAQAHVKVLKFSLLPDGQLQIKAQLGLSKVHYELQPLPADAEVGDHTDQHQESAR